METAVESRTTDVNGEVVRSKAIEWVEGCEDGHVGKLVEQSIDEESESWSEVGVDEQELEGHHAFAKDHLLAGEPRDRSFVGSCFVVCDSCRHSTNS